MSDYKVEGPNEDEKFEVINVETEEVKAVKDTREEAERLVRVLDEMAKDEEDEV
jgi:hypothetical protein